MTGLLIFLAGIDQKGEKAMEHLNKVDWSKRKYIPRHPIIVKIRQNPMLIPAFILVLLGVIFLTKWCVTLHAYAESIEEATPKTETVITAPIDTAELDRRRDETVLMAKFVAGMRSYVERYGYTKSDIITYAECALNRVIDSRFKCNTVEESLLQPNQWAGFSVNNHYSDADYRLAEVIIDDFYSDAPRPVSSEYCYAELNSNGCWLKTDLSIDSYDNVWRYNG